MTTATQSSTQELQIRADDVILLATGLEDRSLKDLLLTSLKTAVETAKPLLSRDEIVEVISSCTGTALAPFVIDESHREVLVDVVQLCISKKHGQSRFRIVSAETIGTDGGLVVLRTGKTYYTPPQAEQARRGTTTWFMAAHELPTADRHIGLKQAVKATTRWDGEGYAIQLSPAVVKHTLGLLSEERLSAYQQHSYASIRQTRFDQIGLRLEKTSNGGLTISTGSSEATMRFSALCSKHASLLLTESPDNQEGMRRVVIPLPDLDDIPAKTSLMYTRPAQSWASIPAEITVGVTQEQLQTIGNVVGWPDHYLNV